jgi:hypothetical protein
MRNWEITTDEITFDGENWKAYLVAQYDKCFDDC